MAESVPQGVNLTEADKTALEKEVRQALDDYAAAIRLISDACNW